MILYVLRHAIAVERGTGGYADRDRPLTKDGRQKMRAIAKGMVALDLGVQRILASPYLRATETAEIAAHALGLSVEVWKPLVAEASPRQVITSLLKIPDERVLLVGHEPQLSELISVLICGHREARLDLKKGSLSKLTIDQVSYGRCATLDWILAPAHLRRLT